MKRKPLTETIYALVDPNDYQVRYVGRTTQPCERLIGHISAAKCDSGGPRLNAWVKSLAPLQPVLVVLQEGLKIDTSTAHWHVDGIKAETKWIKRFRRTVLNRRLRNNNREAWDSLTNPE